MLRLPKFDIERPTTIDAVVALLDRHGDDAQIIAGGTDLVPNMKHELFTPRVVVSIASVPELHGVRLESDGSLVIGAMTTLDELANDASLRENTPALASAASVISGPQLRRMGTLGGNVMLDTRCQWYNQTHFWRKSLGYCLKKDGTECFVVASGQKCVAAASNDTAPALMTLGATLVFHGTDGRRELLIDDLWQSDGIYNKRVRGELLTEIRIPPRPTGHRGAYAKLRDRHSIDFPLLGVAARVDLAPDGTSIEHADVCLVALQARPTRLKRVSELLTGTSAGSEAFDDAVDECAARAYKQCRPLANIPGDHEYRREMVPVFVRRALRACVDAPERTSDVAATRAR